MELIFSKTKQYCLMNYFNTEALVNVIACLCLLPGS